MGEALFELEQVLRSQKEVTITRQEAELLGACKSMALKESTLASLLAGGVVWTTTWKLNGIVRLSLAGGAAFMTGMHRVGKCLDSCASHILSLDGTRMQHELAKIMVNRYGDDPQKMQLLSQHFYSEKVFDDSGTDLPKRLYRLRNMYDVDAARSQKTFDSCGHDHVDDSHNTSSSNPANHSKKRDDADNATQRIAQDSWQANFVDCRQSIATLSGMILLIICLVTQTSTKRFIAPIINLILWIQPDVRVGAREDHTVDTEIIITSSCLLQRHPSHCLL